MNRCVRAWLLTLALVGLVGSPALARSASAATLPDFTAPSPAKFDLTGNISVGDSQIKLSATGAQSGDQFQQDMTITPASGPALTFNTIQIGSMFYFKITGSEQWQVIDLSKTPGNVPNIQSSIPGLNGFNPNGGQRTYEAAIDSQELGKETINGVATTKYQANVDVAKLYTSIGTPAAQAAQIGAVSKMMLYLWIGDSDKVLYQQQVVLNSKAPGPGGALLDVVVDFTITYHDIGTPVTITAPPNAVPYMPQPQVPPASPASLVDIVRAFVEAYNAGNVDAMRNLVDPSFHATPDPHDPDAHEMNFDEFVAPPRVHVTINSITQTAPDTVVAELTITGGDIPPLPHPFVDRATFTIVNGRITHIVDAISEQTLQDIEAFGSAPSTQPGMPKTGTNTPARLVELALVAALICILLGVLARRTYAVRR